MRRVSLITVLYLLLLVGSIAFGFEALLIGFGGQLGVLYRRRRAKALGLALATGLAIVVPALIVSFSFGLEPVYLCALVLVLTPVAGKIMGLFRGKLLGPSLPPRLPLPPEEEFASMLEKRGLGELVEEEKEEE